ncbi:uncharacterized protein L203_101115 [Cryptococcus depauperatus CBS 7841]|uniref:Uncharacterized protein n=1 Tax=Cryptococcus depauperatus CBS 7841 TaxID=1295531 RepID=A0A1E3IK91_9TREE|nr:hypothetical protein L203_02418 [Cryptococcus depauperatus CBS 7841]
MPDIESRMEPSETDANSVTALPLAEKSTAEPVAAPNVHHDQQPKVDTNTSPAPIPSSVNNAPSQSVNRNDFKEEVDQVMDTLNSWWGGVKKQSASAFTTLKADIDKTVSQAQADFEFLKTAKMEVVRKESSYLPITQDVPMSDETQETSQPKLVDKGKGKESALLQQSPSEEQPGGTAFFELLATSTLQFQNSIRSSLKSTIEAAASNPTLSSPQAIRQQLAHNLRLSSARENLQLSVKQAEKLAEEYLRKGDQWFKGAEKWMEDAVKVVPPNEEETHIVSLGWDGSDWYSFSTSNDLGNEKHDSRSLRSHAPLTSPASSRKDALLQQLREDKGLLMVDPEGENETEKRKAEFREWVKDHWEHEMAEGKLKEEGFVGEIRMELVPEHLTDIQFWQRYFFHKHMIEAEEQRRKLLLQVSQQDQADDFNWDDEPEETTPPNKSRSSPGSSTDVTTPKVVDKSQLPPTNNAEKKPIISVIASPHDSEESYDLVSDQSGKNAKVLPPTEDEDSDWE